MSTGDLLAGPMCPNCGGRLDGRFCARCSQRARAADTLLDLAHEWWERAFGREAILWSTLRRLVFSPGGLTLDWWEGRRAAIMSPVRTVLVVLLLAGALATIEHLLVGAADVDVAKLVAAFVYQLVGVGVLVCIRLLPRLLGAARQRTDYEIATFALYEGAFFGLLVLVMLVGLIVSNVLPPALAALLSAPALVVVPLLAVAGLAHSVLHMKQAFGLSWMGAAARFLVLAPVIAVAMFFVSVILAATGVADLWTPGQDTTEFGTFHRGGEPAAAR